MTYSANNEIFIIKYFIEENGIGEELEINEHYEVISSNCSISDMKEELINQGVTIEKYIDDEKYYLLLKVKK